MQRVAFGVVLTAMLAAAGTAMAQAPSWTPPPESARCPSKWGANDERGSANHMKPQSVLNAAKLIKTGEVIELGHVLGAGMPLVGTRRFDVHIKRTFLNQFSNMRGSNEEIVISEIGQVGTQFDGFAHQTHMNSWYNCFKVDENATRSGFTKLGIHNVGALITRGVLIDVAGYKGVEMLGDNYEITVEDLEGALKKQNVTLQPGDAVLINTGWGKLWAKDNARYGKSCPGIGVKAARMAGGQGPDAARLRQLAGRGRAQSRQAGLAAGAPDRAGGERHSSAREPQARRAGGEGGLRVRLHHAAAEDPGRLRLDRRPGRRAVARQLGLLPRRCPTSPRLGAGTWDSPYHPQIASSISPRYDVGVPLAPAVPACPNFAAVLRRQRRHATFHRASPGLAPLPCNRIEPPCAFARVRRVRCGRHFGGRRFQPARETNVTFHGHRGSRRRLGPVRKASAEELAAVRKLGLTWREDWRAEKAAQPKPRTERRRRHRKEPEGESKAAGGGSFAEGIARAEFGRFYWNARLAGELAAASRRRRSATASRNELVLRRRRCRRRNPASETQGARGPAARYQS